MTRIMRFEAMILLSLALPGVALADAPDPVAVQPQEERHPGGHPGDALRVFLITMGPGDHVWEHFGHNALWIHDPARGTEQAYNYGLFDFDQPGFIRNFLQGRMLYSMGGFDAHHTVAHYRELNRSVWVQELNLTPSQKLQLRDFMDWNERPENAYYWYDYYRDNCSTRIRDALDRVLGGRLRAQTEGELTGTTYRSHTRRLTAHDRPIHFGIGLATGQPVDRPLSVWEEMFIPMRMQAHLRDLTVMDEAGNEVPFVLDESTWFVADREPAPGTPPRTWPLMLVVGIGIGAVLAGLGTAAARYRGPAAIGFGLVAGAWLLFNGVLGTIIAGLWAFTDHYVTYSNENVLQFHPLSLVLLAVIVAGRWSHGARDAARLLAFAVAALALLGVLLKVLPAFHQMNADILALAVPAHLGVAWGLHARSRAGVRAEVVARRPAPRRQATQAERV